ncbi:MAG: hypothetical protein AMXMBFR58_21370 [Phycisphaerae bacterium]
MSMVLAQVRLFELLALIPIAAALGLVAWGLFHDRSRGRRRCPTCWYGFEKAPEPTAAAPLVCPECGRRIESPRHLLRTRRRWWPIAAAFLLVAAGYVTWNVPLIRSSGWVAIVPTRVLMEMLPLEEPGGRALREMQRRLMVKQSQWRGQDNTPPASAMSDRELASVLGVIRRGNRFARPMDEEWKASYGRLWQSARSLFMVEKGMVKLPGGSEAPPVIADAVLAMADIPPSVRVRTRDRWPAGGPITIYAEVENVWPFGFSDDQVLRWRTSSGMPLTETKFRWHIDLDVDQTGPVVLEGELDVLRSDGSGRMFTGAVVKTVPVRLEFTIGGAVDDVIEPVKSPALDLLLASGTKFDFERGMVDYKPASLPIEYQGMVTAGVFEVCEGDTVIYRSFFRSLAQSQSWTIGPMFNVDERGSTAIREGRINPDWVIKVRSDGAHALTDIDATRYWVGEFEVRMK